MRPPAIWEKLKEIVRKMFGIENIEQALNLTPLMSSKMQTAIEEWTDLYMGKAEWLHEPTYNDPTRIVSLGLPSFICSEKARMAMIEFRSEITAPKKEEEKINPNYAPPSFDNNGNLQLSGESKTIVEEKIEGPEERALFMNEQYQNKLLPNLRTQLEYGIAKGSLIIKPYVLKKNIKSIAGIAPDMTDETPEYSYVMDFDFIQADCFYPLAFDSNGKLSEVAFIQTKTDKNTLFIRLEHHRLANNILIVTNRAYKQENATNLDSIDSLGTPIDLSVVPEWKDMPVQAKINNVDKLLFGYFKMPDANTIDPHSPLGISGFARAKSLIKDADMQYSRLLWEYEAGEMAIDIDRDALMQRDGSDGNTHTVMGNLQRRLYRTIDLGESDTYKPYAPALRDSSLINGLNNILMRIEDVCALSRGTLSEVAAEARTATELKILKQRTYSSNLEIQKALETAIKDTVYAMNVYCTIYNIVGDVKQVNGKVDAKSIGQYDISFEWDDSILVDVDVELNKRLLLLDKGIDSKVEVRMWYHGETRRQAIDALERVRDENQVAIEQNAMFSSQMGKQFQNENKEEQGQNKPPSGQEKGKEEEKTEKEEA